MYNLHAIPGFAYAVINNRNTITGQKIYTHDEDTIRSAGQLGLYALQMYFPFVGEGKEIALSDSDLSVAEKIFNLSGLGFIYNGDDQQSLYKKFEAAYSGASTVGDRERAKIDYQKGLKRLGRKLNGYDYPDVVNELANQGKARRAEQVWR
jgi:hypothetical protein